MAGQFSLSGHNPYSTSVNEVKLSVETEIVKNLLVLLAVALDTSCIGLSIGVCGDKEELLHGVENDISFHSGSDLLIEVLNDSVIGGSGSNDTVVDTEDHVVAVAHFLHGGNVGHGLYALVSEYAEDGELTGLVGGGKLSNAYADTGDVLAEKCSNSGVSTFVRNVNYVEAVGVCKVSDSNVLNVTSANVTNLHLAGVSLAVLYPSFHGLELILGVNSETDGKVSHLSDRLKSFSGVAGVRRVGSDGQRADGAHEKGVAVALSGSYGSGTNSAASTSGVLNNNVDAYETSKGISNGTGGHVGRTASSVRNYDGDVLLGVVKLLLCGSSFGGSSGSSGGSSGGSAGLGTAASCESEDECQSQNQSQSSLHLFTLLNVKFVSIT